MISFPSLSRSFSNNLPVGLRQWPFLYLLETPLSLPNKVPLSFLCCGTGWTDLLTATISAYLMLYPFTHSKTALPSTMFFLYWIISVEMQTWFNLQNIRALIPILLQIPFSLTQREPILTVSSTYFCFQYFIGNGQLTSTGFHPPWTLKYLDL